MIVTVSKIGSGVTTDDPIRPDTLATNWQVINEFETEFIIEILED